MAWGDWMVVNWTIEEELKIESQARSAFTEENAHAVRSLCASLIRQNAYYERVLRQATGHIAEIEAVAVLQQYETAQQDTQQTTGLMRFLRGSNS